MIAWIAWIALVAASLVVRVVNKRIDCAKRQILAAICDRRLAPLADLMEDDNVREIRKR